MLDRYFDRARAALLLNRHRDRVLDRAIGKIGSQIEEFRSGRFAQEFVDPYFCPKFPDHSIILSRRKNGEARSLEVVQPAAARPNRKARNKAL